MLNRTIAPPVHPIGHLTLPEASRHTLANGISLCSYARPTSGLSQVSVVVRGGTAEGRLPAVAAIMAATITEGADGIAGEQIAETLDFFGARLRADALTHHTVITLETLTDKLADLMPLLVSIITKPDFTPDIIDNFRDREAKTVMHLEAQVSFLSQRALNPLVMGADNPLARPQTVGDVLTVTRQEVMDFHRAWWQGSNMSAFLFGDFTDAHRALVSEALGAIPAGEQRAISLYPFTPMAPQRVDVDKPDAQQSSVRMALPAMERSHPDYLPLRITVMALGGYFGSRLMKNIREDKGYTYGIQSYLSGSLDGSTVCIGAQCDASYVDVVIDETAREMRLMASEPLSESEMLRVREHIATSLIDNIDNAFSLADYYRMQVTIALPPSYFADQVRLIHTITPADIQHIAARYLDPAALRIATTGALS